MRKNLELLLNYILSICTFKSHDKMKLLALDNTVVLSQLDEGCVTK